MPSASYFLGSRFLGQSSFPSPTSVPSSEAFICTSCGETWARIVVAEARHWYVNAHPCPKHRPTGVADWSTIPGALTLDDPTIVRESRALRNLPLEAVRAEFVAHLNHFTTAAAAA